MTGVKITHYWAMFRLGFSAFILGCTKIFKLSWVVSGPNPTQFKLIMFN